jgi:5-methyltetrahydropteroyltriglutamate--homocysteine methyltransferase
MPLAHILGFPRIGIRRELKTALEAHWRGELSETQLREQAAELRRRHWQLQRAAGMDLIIVGDFAFYDQVHNLTALLGAAPPRFGLRGPVDLAGYFAMARGTAQQPALAMKKWFDTNYHYLVPEIGPETRFELNRDWLLPQVREALALAHPVKVVLPGPLTWLWLATASPATDRLALLGPLLRTYRVLLAEIGTLGVDTVQIDEPILAQDLPPAWLQAFPAAYRELSAAGPKILLATYFGGVAEHAPMLARLPIDGLHLDLVRAPAQLDAILEVWPRERVLSLGVVDGRNIWRTDLSAALGVLRRAHAVLGHQLWLSASCSLLHVPIDLEAEHRLDPQIRDCMAFAVQKLAELSTLKQALTGDTPQVQAALRAADAARERRQHAASTRRAEVRARVAALTPASARRQSPSEQRRARQRVALNLPLLPTTTIGSFPQTAHIRSVRAAFRRGSLDAAQYEQAIEAAIRDAVERQEALGLDVLVHGEAERTDMVEYFAPMLDGCAVTENGWVQSYGSRCVKPPVIYGDVSRPAPMTLRWARYAQSLSAKPLKGMLTGPITLLTWSFVRDDLPRRDVALQLALAIRDEVCDLEAAGIRVIQIDEPAIREGLPLRSADRPAYLEWAVQAFCVASCGVRDETQIHTHMCYSEFNDILPSIAALDADVVTIETSRSRMRLLDTFADFHYPNDIGPGLYDIHSPRVPSAQEMDSLLQRALAVIPMERLWVNPDCGLKTRAWAETEAALRQMVATAQAARAQLRR